MTVYKGCVLFKETVFLPAALRHCFLQKLHENHPGIVAMKTLARELIWYPGVDKDIESMVSNCTNCQKHRVRPPQTSHVQWPTPKRPWSRVHIDHFFIDNSTCLVAVDATSHYIEVEIVKNTSTNETIDALRVIFSHNGLPDTVVSDNASCFTSVQFTQFLKNNGIEHITSPPFFPSSSGLAERAVRLIKDLLKKLGKQNSWSLRARIANILLYQRSVHHSVTQTAPSVTLNQRKYINAHDRVHPSFSFQSKEQNDVKQIPQYGIGDHVLALNMSRGDKWLRAQVIDKLGINTYHVFVPEMDVVWKRHRCQLSGINTQISEQASADDSCQITTRPPVNTRQTRNKRNINPPVRFGYDV